LSRDAGDDVAGRNASRAELDNASFGLMQRWAGCGFGARRCCSSGVVRAGGRLARNWQPPVVLLIALSCCWDGACLSTRHGAVVAVAGVWIRRRLWCAEVQSVSTIAQALLEYADGLSRTVRGRIVRVRSYRSSNREETRRRPYNMIEPEVRAAGTLSVDLGRRCRRRWWTRIFLGWCRSPVGVSCDRPSAMRGVCAVERY